MQRSVNLHEFILGTKVVDLDNSKVILNFAYFKLLSLSHYLHEFFGALQQIKLTSKPAGVNGQ